MDYKSALKYLESLPSWEAGDDVEFRLDRVRELVGPMSARVVHVAGSKGKGSVCAMIAQYLHAAGFSVGMFTSPHMLSVCERIWLNGADISEEEFGRLAEGLPDDITYFEALTVMALRRFSDLDFAVVEVGLGGRLDATNVVKPAVTVLMRIELEHTAILGDTLAAILREKLGICKDGVPLVVAEQCEEVMGLLREREFVYGGDNRGVAREVLKILFGSVDERLLVGPRLVGRFDVRGNVVLDMAHTVESMRRLIGLLKERFSGKKFVFLLAFLKDKNVRGMMELIRPVASEVYFSDVETDRGIPAAELGEVREFSDIRLKKDEILVVTGSHFLVSKVLKETRL